MKFHVERKIVSQPESLKLTHRHRHNNNHYSALQVSLYWAFGKCHWTSSKCHWAFGKWHRAFGKWHWEFCGETTFRTQNLFCQLIIHSTKSIKNDITKPNLCFILQKLLEFRKFAMCTVCKMCNSVKLGSYDNH